MLFYIPETDSTNTQLLRYCDERVRNGEAIENLTTFYTFSQTAGRGQQGNAWHSEAGMNLLFSTVFCFTEENKALQSFSDENKALQNCSGCADGRPLFLHPSEQFRLTELVALAVCKTVNSLLSAAQTPAAEPSASIKWPNDIYVDNRKLCGMLIENRLQGSRLLYSVAGVGLNVNQTAFPAHVPNPVSIRQLTGEHYDLHSLLKQLLQAFEQHLPLLHRPAQLHSEYMSLLFRRTGYHLYQQRECSAEPSNPVFAGDSAGDVFSARIEDVEADGRLCLVDLEGNTRLCHFKQIRYVF